MSDQKIAYFEDYVTSARAGWFRAFALLVVAFAIVGPTAATLWLVALIVPAYAFPYFAARRYLEGAPPLFGFSWRALTQGARWPVYLGFVGATFLLAAAGGEAGCIAAIALNGAVLVGKIMSRRTRDNLVWDLALASIGLIGAPLFMVFDGRTPLAAVVGVYVAIGVFILTLVTAVEGVLKRVAQLAEAKAAAEQQRQVAEIRQYEAEAQRATAEEAHRIKSLFLANISHELRTPLNAVIGYAEMLQEDMQDANRPDSAADAARIHAAGISLLATIDDVLTIARIDAGTQPLALGACSIAEIIVAATAGEPRVRVSIDPACGAIWSDAARLQKCVRLLLANALQRAPEATLRVSLEADQLAIAVADRGLALSEAEIVALFEPFAQADGSLQIRRGDTGLGLALAQRTARLLGGDIVVTSDADATIFTLSAPARGDVSVAA